MNFETIIGLEVHVQLQTRTKLFCRCSTKFGAPPNTQTCPICIGMPGTLPVMNREAFRLALKTATCLSTSVMPPALLKASIFAGSTHGHVTIAPSARSPGMAATSILARRTANRAISGSSRNRRKARVTSARHVGPELVEDGVDAAVWSKRITLAHRSGSRRPWRRECAQSGLAPSSSEYC